MGSPLGKMNKGEFSGRRGRALRYLTIEEKGQYELFILETEMLTPDPEESVFENLRNRLKNVG